MKIGFTGTREGMTENQLSQLHEILKWYSVFSNIEFHHGDCVGADEQADSIAKKFNYEIHIHPPTNEKYRAFCSGVKTKIHYVKDYLDRNRDIVDMCDVLIAGPKDGKTARSGTWYTVNYAKRLKKNNYNFTKVI